jgi:predicted nucleic acid-binding Zn ribbon protein
MTVGGEGPALCARRHLQKMDPTEKRRRRTRMQLMSLSTILLIVLVLLLIGALPTWPYSSGWGYYPSGGLGLVLIVLLVVALLR